MKLRTVHIVNLVLCSVLIIGTFLVARLPDDYLLFGFIAVSLWALGIVIFNLIFWRCPHCHTYLWKVTWMMAYCPYCGASLKDENHQS